MNCHICGSEMRNPSKGVYVCPIGCSSITLKGCAHCTLRNVLCAGRSDYYIRCRGPYAEGKVF